MLDPRLYPRADSAPAPLASVYALVEASLAAGSGQEAAIADAGIMTVLDGMVALDGQALAQLFTQVPSGAVYRHLWRLLDASERNGATDSALRVTMFAIPLIVVAALDTTTTPATTLTGVVDDISALAAILREHRALAGNENFGLGNALVAADALEFARLPALFARRALSSISTPLDDLAPAPIIVSGTTEAV
ncbi:MAG: hypothetical protein ABI777_14145, partial [Betaproteobacteria bacterium]